MAETPNNKDMTLTLAEDEAERQKLLDAQQLAHRDDSRGFKEDALTEKLVHVEPDGTGPTPTTSFDPPADAQAAEHPTARAAKKRR